MLHVHRAERADRLADGLAKTLLDPLEDRFAAEVVAVPTRGIERWLAQRLSTRLGSSEGRFDGVCANVEFPFPGRLVVGALAAATGIDPDGDPWLAERSVWPLLEVVDQCLGEPWLATLAAHLDGARGEPGDPTRRFSAVRRIADLFDRYAVHRPERIQADVREDRQPSGPRLPGDPDTRPRLDPSDRSVQVHACHGRARQVEVLRDAVLHLLEEDRTLEPRDVIVMCPEIETFAPLIQATFGAGRIEAPGEDDRELEDRRLPDLRVRLADRSLRQTNPVLGVISRLLELADQRVTASELLDLADREPVRRRFGFDDDEVTRLQDWVVASGSGGGLTLRTAGRSSWMCCRPAPGGWVLIGSCWGWR